MEDTHWAQEGPVSCAKPLGLIVAAVTQKGLY